MSSSEIPKLDNSSEPESTDNQSKYSEDQSKYSEDQSKFSGDQSKISEESKPSKLKKMSNLMYLKNKYKRLNEEFKDSGFSKYQFEKSKIKIPYKSIALAIILFITGISMFTIFLVNVILNGNEGLNETFIVMFLLGLIMVIPGAYHVGIAYCSYKNFPGYDYDMIPDYD